MGDTALSLSINLDKIDCPSCNATYALNSAYVERRRQDGRGWLCPYCHGSTSFHGNDENSKLKKQLAEEVARRDRALADANTLRAEVAAAKAATEKLKRRTANGVCPCCTRSFSNVAQHIRDKHPEFVPGASKAAPAPEAKQPKPPKTKSEYAKQRLAQIKGGGK